MLDTLRKNSSGWVVKILMGMLVLSFALWGVEDYFRGGPTRQSLGKVNGRQIDPNEYNRILKDMLSRLKLSPSDPQVAGLRLLALRNLAQSMLLDAHAGSLDLGIDEKLVIDMLAKMPAFAGEDGAFDRSRFEYILRENHLNETQLVNQFRRDMIQEQLTGTIAQAYVPQPLVEAVNRFQNDQRAIKYFEMPASVAGDIPDPDEATQTAYYEKHKDAFKAPIYRKIGLLLISSGTVKDAIKVSDDEVKAYYSANLQNFELRTVQKITFKTPEEANEAHKKLVDGGDFVKIGKDLGLKESEINIGAFTRGKLPTKLADVVFSLEKDKVSDVQGGLLPAIYRVTAIGQQPFEEAKAAAQEELINSRTTAKLDEVRDNINNDRDSGMSLSDIAKKLNLKFDELTFDNRGNDTEGKIVESLKAAPEVLKQTFETEVGDRNEPLLLTDGYAFVEVHEVVPERQKPLTEVRKEVMSAWREQETVNRIAQKANDLVSRATKGEKLDALAQSVKTSVKQTALMKRTDTQSELPSTALKQAFILEDKGIGSATTDDGKSKVIFQVTEVKAAPAATESEAAVLRANLQRQIGADMITQYVSALQNTYSVQLNSGAISDTSE